MAVIMVTVNIHIKGVFVFASENITVDTTYDDIFAENLDDEYKDDSHMDSDIDSEIEPEIEPENQDIVGEEDFNDKTEEFEDEIEGIEVEAKEENETENSEGEINEAENDPKEMEDETADSEKNEEELAEETTEQMENSELEEGSPPIAADDLEECCIDESCECSDGESCNGDGCMSLTIEDSLNDGEDCCDREDCKEICECDDDCSRCDEEVFGFCDICGIALQVGEENYCWFHSEYHEATGERVDLVFTLEKSNEGLPDNTEVLGSSQSIMMSATLLPRWNMGTANDVKVYIRLPYFEVEDSRMVDYETPYGVQINAAYEDGSWNYEVPPEGKRGHLILSRPNLGAGHQPTITVELSFFGEVPENAVGRITG